MTNKFLRLKNLAALPESHRNSVVAIGNFDGVHRGHQAVLEKALDIARSTGRPAIVYTFEPHPKSFFKPEKPVDRLTPAAEKARILELMGFDGVVEQHFDAKFAHLTAEEFVKHILCENFHASAVVTGSDFHFGSKRVGTPDYLADCGKKLGFAVVKVPPFCDENGQVISSSRIRALLADGKVEEAAGLLGYHYTVCSKVIHGAKLGRTLGFPTANMALPEETGLAFGIYAIRFRRSDGTLFDGVASFGKRPTVEGDGVPLLESFLFLFDGNLYDETASVSFYSYLRGEQKFDGLQPLIAQMNKDKEEAEAALSAASPLSALDRNFTFTNR
ncbi:bifunctional riboflavin kinase/FAD synthetase [Bartonella sp. W8097]|uniref:bifunctional riboflavin kinase/FAD synthetase n=1 Tax=Bartonella apihabitans TaxID=2750929 RepID=UPI0018DB3A24|nr:bifunctional riboflavin kinase/FAD synthetase [Bartonella apihabitans]MBI0019898.1 bifunctional riboflavin kinase/FAD synthetase [Bartonella apihabitans]